MWVALLVVCFLAVHRRCQAQTVKVYVSSKAGDRIAAKPDLQFSDAKPQRRNVPDQRRGKIPEIHGFGASIMEAGMIVLNTLPADKQEEVLRAFSISRQALGTQR